MIYILSILMAVWRRVDGSDSSPKFWHLFPLLLMPFIYSFYGLNTLGAFVVAYIAMLDGFKDWKDFGYMSMRFTGYCAISCALFDIHWSYMLIGFACGMIYPVGNKFKVKHYTEIAEVLTGFGLTLGIFLK